MHIYYFQVCSYTQTTDLRLPSGTELSTKQRQPLRIYISVYDTCTLLLNDKRYNVDIDLDASDNLCSCNEPSSEMLKSKTGMSQHR